MAFSYRLDRSIVSKIVEDVCRAIWEILQTILMLEPNEDILRPSEKVFKERWNFPHCVAALDGKQIHMKTPALTFHLFYNIKNAILLFC